MNSERHILTKVIIDHVDYCFENIGILFTTFTEEDFHKDINGFPIWQHFYHMLNSIDRILTDPIEYMFPPFHIANLNTLEYKFKIQISRAILNDYFNEIVQRSTEYLQNIDEETLVKKSNHKTLYLTKLDHILAQQRHMTWHIGYLHSCAKVIYGNTPEHVLVKDKSYMIDQ